MLCDQSLELSQSDGLCPHRSSYLGSIKVSCRYHIKDASYLYPVISRPTGRSNSNMAYCFMQGHESANPLVVMDAYLIAYSRA